jgi:hypothetical protein
MKKEEQEILNRIKLIMSYKNNKTLSENLEFLFKPHISEDYLKEEENQNTQTYNNNVGKLTYENAKIIQNMFDSNTLTKELLKKFSCDMLETPFNELTEIYERICKEFNVGPGSEDFINYNNSKNLNLISWLVESQLMGNLQYFIQNKELSDSKDKNAISKLIYIKSNPRAKKVSKEGYKIMSEDGMVDFIEIDDVGCTNFEEAAKIYFNRPDNQKLQDKWKTSTSVCKSSYQNFLSCNKLKVICDDLNYNYVEYDKKISNESDPNFIEYLKKLDSGTERLDPLDITLSEQIKTELNKRFKFDKYPNAVSICTGMKSDEEENKSNSEIESQKKYALDNQCPFETLDDENGFREWVNSEYPEIASKLKLSSNTKEFCSSSVKQAASYTINRNLVNKYDPTN